MISANRELDNPSWHALSDEQRQFGVVGERAACYHPSISPIGAVADQSADALQELACLVEPGQAVALFALDRIEGDWEQVWRLAEKVRLSQWICPEPVVAVGDGHWADLSDADADAMYRLAKAADPGPFERQTYRLGDYIGILAERKLVAMAGERLCFAGCREVSAVCTDAAHQGRGYAQALVAEIARRQQQAGCLPFLHVRNDSPTEHQATHVYQKLGFVKRREMDMTVLVRR